MFNQRTTIPVGVILLTFIATTLSEPQQRPEIILYPEPKSEKEPHPYPVLQPEPEPQPKYNRIGYHPSLSHDIYNYRDGTMGYDPLGYDNKIRGGYGHTNSMRAGYGGKRDTFTDYINTYTNDYTNRLGMLYGNRHSGVYNNHPSTSYGMNNLRAFGYAGDSHRMRYSMPGNKYSTGYGGGSGQGYIIGYTRGPRGGYIKGDTSGYGTAHRDTRYEMAQNMGSANSHTQNMDYANSHTLRGYGTGYGAAGYGAAGYGAAGYGAAGYGNSLGHYGQLNRYRRGHVDGYNSGGYIHGAGGYNRGFYYG